MERIRAQRGMLSKIAAEIGVTRGAVAQWKHVPPVHVPAVERVTGIPRHELVPELWDAPAEVAA
jgi:DNA-binding transcriptional regulator YdaS (Cro superfamily)